ncbi:ribonuclease Oy-like isoform X2 [Watersipora subatra]
MSQLLLSTLLVLSVFQPAAMYYFTHYVYAQQWPAAFCIQDQEECAFPKNISSWTVHGLWPSVNESYPAGCNNSWSLNKSTIDPLLDEMRAKWPTLNFNPEATSWEFWEHEWSKHGTCAANVSMLHGPYNFFKFALALNSKYNLLEQLGAHPFNIAPGNDSSYSYKQLEAATKLIYDEEVLLGCDWDGERQYLAQIEICFDKSFQLNCDPEWKVRRSKILSSRVGFPHIEECRKNESIWYLPIPHSD